MFVCGTSYGREGVPVDTLAVSNARIQFSSAVKLLGVHLESDLSLEKQLSSMVKACVFCGVFVCLFVCFAPPEGLEQSVHCSHAKLLML